MIEGDFKLLNAWIKRFNKLGDGDHIKALANDFAEKTLKLTDENFDKRQNPAGIRWRPRKKKYPHPILEKTGKMRRSFRKGQGATVYSTDAKAKYHQYGTKKMARRQMLPGAKLPSRYSRAFTKLARRRYMGILLGKLKP